METFLFTTTYTERAPTIFSAPRKAMIIQTILHQPTTNENSEDIVSTNCGAFYSEGVENGLGMKWEVINSITKERKRCGEF